MRIKYIVLLMGLLGSIGYENVFAMQRNNRSKRSFEDYVKNPGDVEVDDARKNGRANDDNDCNGSDDDSMVCESFSSDNVSLHESDGRNILRAQIERYISDLQAQACMVVDIHYNDNFSSMHLACATQGTLGTIVAKIQNARLLLSRVDTNTVSVSDAFLIDEIAEWYYRFSPTFVVLPVNHDLAIQCIQMCIDNLSPSARGMAYAWHSSAVSACVYDRESPTANICQFYIDLLNRVRSNTITLEDIPCIEKIVAEYKDMVLLPQ
jgi:hypothetical protein